MGSRQDPRRAELAALRTATDSARASFEAAIARNFPGADEWQWQRAVAHIAGENVRRNDDTSCDAALAGCVDIGAAWDCYMTALHAFYLARDGAGGVLGSRGL